MSRDELAVMNGSKCVLQLRGVRPFLSDKFTAGTGVMEGALEIASESLEGFMRS
jgi:hypothetical protein